MFDRLVGKPKAIKSKVSLILIKKRNGPVIGHCCQSLHLSFCCGLENDLEQLWHSNVSYFGKKQSAIKVHCLW